MLGIISGIGSAVGSFLTSSVSAVSGLLTKVASKIGPTISGLVSKVINLGIETLQRVSPIIEGVSKIIGVIKENDNIDDIGDRAIRCERREEDFNSTSEYISYLKENFEARDLEKLSAEERLLRKAIGSAILSKAISEKLSLEIPIELWKVAIEAGLSAKELDSFLKQFKQDGIKPEDFVKYLKQELAEKEEQKIEDVLVSAYKELEPDTPIFKIEEKVVGLPYRK